MIFLHSKTIHFCLFNSFFCVISFRSLHILNSLFFIAHFSSRKTDLEQHWKGHLTKRYYMAPIQLTGPYPQRTWRNLGFLQPNGKKQGSQTIYPHLTGAFKRLHELTQKSRKCVTQKSLIDTYMELTVATSFQQDKSYCTKYLIILNFSQITVYLQSWKRARLMHSAACMLEQAKLHSHAHQYICTL